MKKTKLGAYVIFAFFLAPLWIWIALSSDNKFLSKLQAVSSEAHTFGLTVFFGGGLLATIFMMYMARESKHKMKWIIMFSLGLVIILLLLLPNFG